MKYTISRTVSFGCGLRDAEIGLDTRDISSCEGNCGLDYNSAFTCQCDYFCRDYFNCCVDYVQSCSGTCEGRCGKYTPDFSCQCNMWQCEYFGDCCSDYDQFC
ncbi:Proteoglycan 4 [Holothuria leucospilota]|uniref:Proteoglycan 4 n=1 Tax=Holothuria leucospilota TaxID=206669 RepID=A0A9Q1H1P3_HOLLE|nr:Proteoglycan 4 [Holothuria leucospilota]